MQLAAYQPMSQPAMEMFRQRARGVDSSLGCTSCVPGVSAFNPWPISGVSALQGLGDWFTDAVGSVAKGVTGIIGAVTGEAGAADTQRNALAVAQIQAQRAAIEAQSTQKMVLYGAGAVAVVAIAAALILKK